MASRALGILPKAFGELPTPFGNSPRPCGKALPTVPGSPSMIFFRPLSPAVLRILSSAFFPFPDDIGGLFSVF
jgi:hypothetical protein